MFGCMIVFVCYDIENVKVVGYDVVSNWFKCVVYRVLGVFMMVFVVESIIDEISEKIEMDFVEFCLKNVVMEGICVLYGVKFKSIGFE